MGESENLQHENRNKYYPLPVINPSKKSVSRGRSVADFGKVG